MKKLVLVGVAFLFSFSLKAQAENTVEEKNIVVYARDLSEKNKTINEVDVKIFPNPSVHNFTVDTPEHLTLKVFDNLGHVVEEFKTGSGQKTFGEDLLPGVYHVNFFKGNRMIKSINVVKNW